MRLLLLHAYLVLIACTDEVYSTALIDYTFRQPYITLRLLAGPVIDKLPHNYTILATKITHNYSRKILYNLTDIDSQRAFSTISKFLWSI